MTDVTNHMARRWRSLLFGAATRQGFVDKAVSVGVDVGILDLEDAVPEAGKAEAREQLQHLDVRRESSSPIQLVVRVNGIHTPHFVSDVKAAAEAGVDGLVVPMLETPGDVRFVRGAMAMAGLAGATLIGGIETARGLLAAALICEAGLDAVYFGAEDFITDVGGVRTPSNLEVLVGRSQVVTAAAAAGIAALDQVVADFADLERFEREAFEARTMGFAGKLCIHPGQVAVANRAFSPSDTEVDHARRILAAAEEAAKKGDGVVVVDGQMVDEPIIIRARAVVAATIEEQA